MQTNESESYTFKFRTFKRVFFLLGILALGMTVLLFSNGSTAAAARMPRADLRLGGHRRQYHLGKWKLAYRELVRTDTT